MIILTSKFVKYVFLLTEDITYHEQVIRPHGVHGWQGV